MTPTTSTPPSQTPPKPRRKKPGRRVLIHNVDWAMYEKLLEAFLNRRNAKLTYDRGDLEIMAPSNEHEEDAAILGAFVSVLTREYKLPFRHGGGVTLKRKILKRGIEPDRCFWIASAAKLAGIRKLDLKIHPPPDLAIEVDVTNSSLDKLGIYAKLGVAELWRLDGDELRFYQLGAKQKYTEVATSPTFPGVPPSEVMKFLKQVRGAVDQHVGEDAFRVRVQAHVAAQPPPAPPPP